MLSQNKCLVRFAFIWDVLPQHATMNQEFGTLIADSACELGAHICLTGLALVTDVVIELLKASLLSDATLYLCEINIETNECLMTSSLVTGQ